ncbi:hypothetical protein AMS68_002461 [Peltaster fructicola]|uniref:ATP synthase subunit delta, mitochondrial n=1 Tax=Peltaster fructicola TaxID=286661 RepID=A0A6H0XQD9_9PEZI|nr:hypothetical protein AMS68_002461 [Peltaster fructicola]
MARFKPVVPVELNSSIEQAPSSRFAAIDSSHHHIDNELLRVARAALRVRPTALKTLQKRGYADAVPDKIKLSLALPHQAIYKSRDVVQVNIPAESGEMGILANHVPSIEQLKPGLVEVIEEAGGSKQFFLSGGFATVQPDSQLSINAVEGYALSDFSAENVRNQIAEAQKIANGSGSEQDIAEAKIELEGSGEPSSCSQVECILLIRTTINCTFIEQSIRKAGTTAAG